LPTDQRFVVEIAWPAALRLMTGWNSAGTKPSISSLRYSPPIAMPTSPAQVANGVSDRFAPATVCSTTWSR
jgi:hypothetical protein